MEADDEEAGPESVVTPPIRHEDQPRSEIERAQPELREVGESLSAVKERRDDIIDESTARLPESSDTPKACAGRRVKHVANSGHPEPRFHSVLMQPNRPGFAHRPDPWCTGDNQGIKNT